MEKHDYLESILNQYGQYVFGKWCAPKDGIYIGRGSQFGNPFPMKSEADRVKVCLQYHNYLREKVKDPEFRQAVKALKGKNVVCFCSNGTCSRKEGARYCHGHVLQYFAHHLQ